MRDSLDGETDCTNSSDLCFKSPLTSCHSSDDDGGVTVTESSLSMRYESPPNYKQFVHVTNVDMCKEKLEDEDVELWLCKMPADIDVKKLNGQAVNLCGSINIKEIKETKYSKTTELVFEKIHNNQRPSSLTVLSLSKTDSQLHPVGKQIQGFLTVRELPTLEDCVLPPCRPKQKKQIPDGLKRRYQPFGSETPVVSSIKHKKKKRKKSTQD